MKSKHLFYFGGVSIAFLSLVPQLASAGGEPAGFSWLVGIPGVAGGGFNQYINALYALAISLAALIAVLKIVIAGAKYMMDDIVTHKSEAKQDIKNALIGLLIVIGAVIILNTINTDLTNVQVDATPATVNDDPLQFIDRQATLIDQALGRNSSITEIQCEDISSQVANDGDAQSCREDCSRINGLYNDYLSLGINRTDTCTVAQDTADQCQANSSAVCCENIKGGTWNGAGTTNPCTGLDAAEEIRIRQCYSGGNGTWDEAAGTCRTTDCNPNTSSQCCALGFGGTLEGGRCVTGTSELDCQNLGRVWDPTTNTCAPGTVSTNETSCRARGAGFVWRAGSCLEYTNTFPAQVDNCAEGDTSCLDAQCQSGGSGIVYIPELQMCGTDPRTSL